MKYFDRVSERCGGRVALLGNPSDGFYGATLGIRIKNYAAEVTITSNEDRKIVLEPNPDCDGEEYESLAHLYEKTKRLGYYGGLRIIRATLKKFQEIAVSAGVVDKLRPTGFTVSYTTTIPRGVGLSGSSALVAATFRALLRFHHVSLWSLGIELDKFPQTILDVEQEELGICAGLQDRVIQVYGGLRRGVLGRTTNIHFLRRTEKKKWGITFWWGGAILAKNW